MRTRSLALPFVTIVTGAAGCGVEVISNPPALETGAVDAGTDGVDAGDGDAGDGDGTSGDGDGTTGDGDGTSGDGDGATGDGDGDGTSGDGDGATGDGDGTCAQQPDPSACSTCCATDHPAGFQTFDTAFSACGCFSNDSCYGDCSSTGGVCGPGGAPTGLCLSCVEASITQGECSTDVGFDQACAQDASCAEYVACLESCF